MQIKDVKHAIIGSNKNSFPVHMVRNQNVKELLKFYEFFTVPCTHTYHHALNACYVLTIRGSPAGCAIYGVIAITFRIRAKRYHRMYHQ